MAKAGLPRVAVIGAGPVGLEAALYAHAAGLPVAVYDRGQAAEHLLRWAHVRLFTPFGLSTTPLGRHTLFRADPKRQLPADADHVTAKEFRDGYLAPLAESEPLRGLIQVQHAVVAVGRSGRGKKTDPDDPKRPPGPFRLLVRGPNGAERMDTADVVLDCTGVLDAPNWLGDGGVPAVGEAAARPNLPVGVVDVLGEARQRFADRSVIVVGDGYSAATVVCDLAALADGHPATWVIWLTRGQRTQPLPRLANDPLRERDRLAARANSLPTRCDANLEFHPLTLLHEVVCHGPDQGFRVTGRRAGRPVVWEVDRVIAAVGYRPSLAMCEQLRVDEPVGKPETREPGYFVLGARSFGRDSGFLLRDGHDQIRRVFAAVLGKPGLDLYAGKAA